MIHRTVKDVEGIELTKVRQPVPFGGKEYFDPMWSEAAMAGQARGDDYLKSFLVSEHIYRAMPSARGELGPPTLESKTSEAFLAVKKGYDFVEYLDPNGGQRFRCTPDWSQQHPNWIPGQHHCKPVAQSSTRYALDYEDIVNRADRQLWVAGTRLKVMDKRTGEVIATYTKFIWDPGFGVSTTGRWPWSHADGMGDRNCPVEPNKQTGKDSRYFVDTVLIPKQGD